MGRTILWATLVAGTLVILSAFVWSALAGGNLANILPTVASGPLGDSIPDGAAGQLLGLLVHFAIMAVMATAYVLVAGRVPALNRYWPIAGLLYGLALWVVMYWIVMPLRWDSYTTPHEAAAIARQLISHCLLVGLPIAWITARAAAIRPSFN
jgi:hypothetical protein